MNVPQLSSFFVDLPVPLHHELLTTIKYVSQVFLQHRASRSLVHLSAHLPSHHPWGRLSARYDRRITHTQVPLHVFSRDRTEGPPQLVLFKPQAILALGNLAS